MSDGLEDVVAANTVMSEVDGQRGVLIIRGHSLDELAGATRFEDLVRILFDGFFDDLPADLAPALGAARAEVFSEVAALDPGLLDLTPVEAMRALTARLGDGDDLPTALRLIAAPAVFTAAVVRAHQGQAPVAPDPALSHAADVLRMIAGKTPTKAQADALDTYLVTVSDHGLNASTFAARVIASTRAGLTSAVLGGISALKGPLHGGAPGPVIEMLDEIGQPSNARAWIEQALAQGERLMGFGHRVYRVRDPRADALKAAVRRLDDGSNARPGRIAFAEAVEAAALAILKEHKPNRPLDTNVEFYTALLLEALDFPPNAFTCVFAMGRVAGWIAHAREQVAGGRLIRPQSVYVGPAPLKAA
ncbi:citrate synthase [Phenylobacterium sp. Root77]|uniref:citrate synthase/methylcitrate synthase n=1 Tax=unclassified Phenylobacterium TaxID=2640670 RepID=UPI0006F4B93D|nr:MULTISPECIES: citrate synthase/methylcitrate synthase [unclassified Phenylobacterium]KQW69340.1 citrate synthase [Phenylobacterium sp. Root1277]KQW95294.1 citrate synthase [Phenylobacterium sp. Root1290]KRC41085.1 citrate synthase [Phenylobacterium sp. Root77]